MFDQLTRLLKEEEETAQTFDYVPTSIDEQGHTLDQFGIRIQKTTRPPYISPDEWMKMRGKDKRVAIEEFEVGVEKLKEIREGISDLKLVLDDYYKRGGVRAVVRPEPLAAGGGTCQTDSESNEGTRKPESDSDESDGYGQPRRALCGRRCRHACHA